SEGEEPSAVRGAPVDFRGHIRVRPSDLDAAFSCSPSSGTYDKPLPVESRACSQPYADCFRRRKQQSNSPKIPMLRSARLPGSGTAQPRLHLRCWGGARRTFRVISLVFGSTLISSPDVARLERARSMIGGGAGSLGLYSTTATRCLPGRTPSPGLQVLNRKDPSCSIPPRAPPPLADSQMTRPPASSRAPAPFSQTTLPWTG